MSTYQVWAKDTYGHHEPLTVNNTKGLPESKWASPIDALAAAKRYVHDQNRNNPLTYDEQKKSVNHLVMETTTGIYCGNLVRGKHTQLVVDKAKNEIVEIPFDVNQEVKFYAGQTPKNEAWYMTDPRNRPIVKMADYHVSDMTLVFVHKNND